MKKNILISLFAFLFLTSSAQNNDSINRISKHKIWLTTMDGKVINGILLSTSDSSVEIFTGKKSENGKPTSSSTINESYLNISEISVHKNRTLVKNLLIGGGIGLAPVLIGSIFGESIGQGGAYLSMITFPVGIITGVITGISSRKRFLIGGDKRKFYAFHKQMKY